VTQWVIDASIAFSWVHPDQSTPETRSLLLDVERGAALVVPSLWFTEVANGLLVLQRRKRITANERLTALQRLENLNPTIDEPSGRASFSRTSELAEAHGLTVYDATYLEIAVRRKLALATRDAPLRKAAKAEGLHTL
jgi:predicted nucleic acid-binding protein